MEELSYTDVAVLAVSFVQQIHAISELWVVFGISKSYCYIPANTISQALGNEKVKALPFVHAFSGCDTVSAF